MICVDQSQYFESEIFSQLCSMGTRTHGFLFHDDFCDFLDALDVGVFIIDRNGFFVAVNRQFERITSLTRADVTGRSVEELLESGALSVSVAKMVLEQRCTVTTVCNYKGEEQVIATGVPIWDDMGGIRLVVGTMRDWDMLNNVYKKYCRSPGECKGYAAGADNQAAGYLADSEIIAADKVTRNILETASRVAGVDSTVLLLGESGAGKDALARFIHRCSPRAKGNFIQVNCGAIPETLFESELFGYANGAFTGANRAGKPGLVEMANGGTLFLDEVAELPLWMQAKLLQVLQNKCITRVGDTKEKLIDVRIVVATNQDLEKMMRAGRFRADLYYRLNVFQIYIPALRERKDDIQPFIAYFLEKFNRKYNLTKRISNEAVKVLLEYHWPGNVRELGHLIEQLIVLCPLELIGVEHLPLHITDSLFVEEVIRSSGGLPLKDIMEKVEKAVINDSLAKSPSLEDAARVLGIDISTLWRKKQKYRLCKKDCRRA